MSRITVQDYATLKGLHPESVRRLCREGKKIVARREHGNWMIDPARTDHLQSLVDGNAIERSLAIKSKEAR